MQFQVLLIKDISTKIGSVRVPKGNVLTYDDQSKSIIVKLNQFTDVHISARLGKDVIRLEWIQIKPRIRKASARG